LLPVAQEVERILGQIMQEMEGPKGGATGQEQYRQALKEMQQRLNALQSQSQHQH
jgi:hypothetical protein